MGLWYLYLYLALPPWNIEMKVECWSPLPHSQALAIFGQAKLSLCAMQDLKTVFYPCQMLCSSAPFTRPLPTSPRGCCCAQDHPAPIQPLWGSSITSAFCFQASHAQYSSENNIICLPSCWFWPWVLRWDQHLSSCELSPAKTLCIIFEVLCLLPTPLQQAKFTGFASGVVPPSNQTNSWSKKNIHFRE